MLTVGLTEVELNLGVINRLCKLSKWLMRHNISTLPGLDCDENGLLPPIATTVYLASSPGSFPLSTRERAWVRGYCLPWLPGILCNAKNVEHCGGDPEKADTRYYVTDE